MVRTLVPTNDPVLRAVAAPVTEFDTPELHLLIRDMIDTMRANGGCGLAAPQIGVSLRIAVAECPSKNVSTTMVIINPEVLDYEGESIDKEGCLSIPGFWTEVSRAENITLLYNDRWGYAPVLRMSGFNARVILHEIDHLNGILITDHSRPLPTAA